MMLIYPIDLEKYSLINLRRINSSRKILKDEIIMLFGILRDSGLENILI